MLTYSAGGDNVADKAGLDQRLVLLDQLVLSLTHGTLNACKA